ncbi:zinc metallopeptidase [Bacillus marasmi]|uniref:zinc metallopeptidase n=1 Tax=Bacillus marasmi TaxID=1926279 RepID=UPI00164E36F8|nr:zinc metallopeptidase [Bacillus marasmi]
MTPYAILLITIVSFLLNLHASDRLTRIATKSFAANFSGDEIAEKILKAQKHPHIKIRQTDTIGDHLYDPLIKVIQLGPDVFGCKTIYSVAVGSHEACHAVKFQYFRFFSVPVAFIVKFVFIPLFILSFFIKAPFLHGMVLFLYASLFLMKLLIEVLDEVRINRLSIKILNQNHFISLTELCETKKIYRFFNYTYFASLPLKIVLNR